MAMESKVPYLPIDQFESQNQEALIRDFESDKQDCAELFAKGQQQGSRAVEGLKYFDDCNGYSPHVELALQGMGMQKYAPLFQEEDISIDILVAMRDDDFKELGIASTKDREHIVEQLKQFRVENDLLMASQEGYDFTRFDIVGDDLTMARNVCKHITELNSHLAYIHSQISKNPPQDYLIYEFETGLNFFKFTLNHAIIQSNRISELLFGGQFDGVNMITSALNVFGTTLPNFMKEKLTVYHKKRKKLKKRRIIISVLIGVGLGVAVSAILKK